MAPDALMPAIRDDLRANTGRNGLLWAAYAWFFSPGFKVLALYRLSRHARLFGLAGKFASKLFWRCGVASTNCYISPLAKLEGGICLPHPTGVVIGDGVSVGRGTTLYQNVTVGRSRRDEPSYPRIGCSVVVYAGAVIVGKLDVGDGATIAANSVVIESVAPGALVAGVPARPTRT